MFGFVLSQDGYLRELDAILFPSGNLVIFDNKNKEIIYSDIESYTFEQVEYPVSPTQNLED